MNQNDDLSPEMIDEPAPEIDSDDVESDEADVLDAVLLELDDLPPVEEPVEEPPTFADPIPEPEIEPEPVMDIVEPEVEAEAKPGSKKKPKKSKPPKDIRTLSEMLKKYGVKKKEALRAIHDGDLPARQISKDEWLIRRDDARALWGKKGKDKSAGGVQRSLVSVMTGREVTLEFGVKKKKVWKAIREGRLAARKSGDTVLVSRADVEELFG